MGINDENYDAFKFNILLNLHFVFNRWKKAVMLFITFIKKSLTSIIWCLTDSLINYYVFK